MKKILLNILAVILGLFIGGFVNMSIINISGSIIPPPNGIDITTEEGLKAAIPLFEPKHFLFPFLAHAIGTLVGAFITALIAKTYRKILALVIGLAFLIGGIMMVFMVPSPTWFTLTDLILAYIPMAFLGYSFAFKLKK
ncbi:hypothetical protein [Flavobacterium sp. I3-2]|uniref:hypothetical protein n=1 Tax=Flavobacterium sp. I3-2 TaxID=2748319 RepID=UPI0015A81F9F|nr:hypothetical protein [Flavobacterium sp. I3-2]